MKISKATIADVPALNQLINSAYRGESSKQGWTTEEAILGGIRIDEVALRKYFGQDHIHILKYTDAQGRLLGTVNLEVRPDELYLGLFAVSPLAQNLGIGKALLQAAEGIARENDRKKIAITVISSRTELIAWYERNGYRATGKSIAFEDIQDRFGEPKQDHILLIGMEKLLF
ncbi:GNAT family N-acetyltransferase [Pedobacter sandarakinus]|uniref:GNAT family N-acetyltransferase n=1 Tax=Pedobacter sandarakinus TaxID=353156 RepID=UPI00224596FE|nr:GNAT family N-acetyltransferase [Pedobacter sandarakinus]MCX2574006.1 GNAT family N-acetyltransferase [Pedobacter sandarakinus]